MTNEYHLLTNSPFTQDWANTGLISHNNVWDNVPSTIGYWDDNLTGTTGVNPQIVFADGTSTPIVFIDPTVADYQSMVAGVALGAEVVVLDPTRDGVEQISEVLAGRSNVSSIHIVSHGSSGSLQLGAAPLSLDTLDRYTNKLQGWADALTNEADILFYGCDVAAGERGAAFVEQLSQLTKADVAASADLTGSAALGGNWNLEVTTGAVTAPLAFQIEALEAYTSVLAAFTPGNVVIYRVGNGSTLLLGVGTPVFLDEYTPSGSLVQSIALPTADNGANQTLIASGTATAEGLLTRSTDGRYLLLTGYDAALGTTLTLVNHVIGRVDAAGGVDTTTAVTDAAGNPRSATSTNGTGLWFTTASSGVRYATLGSTTSTQLSTTSTNLRQVNIFNGQLYTSSGSGSLRLGTVGTGTPTTSGQTITNLPGFPTTTGSPYGFFFADLNPAVAGVDTLYVADDGTAALTKYSLVGGNWASNGRVGADADDYRGLTASVSGTTVTLYATRNNNQLVSLVDSSGYNGAFSGTPTPLATAAANTAFRGVALAPVVTFIQRTGTDNPLNAVAVASSSIPTFADIDSDGDSDAIVGDLFGKFRYYRNNGNGSFSQLTGTSNPFNGIDVGFFSTPTFADLDGDSDLDLFSGEQQGTVKYYRNNGTSFSQVTDSTNAFNNVDVGNYSNLAFANIDGDSDLDAFFGLEDGTIAYYRNNNNIFSPQTGTFDPVTGNGNPVNGIDVGNYSFPTFANVDGDGDLDAFIGNQDGNIAYYRNDGGIFSPQTGTNNYLNGIDVGEYSAPTFVDVNKDGDLDAFIGAGLGFVNFFSNQTIIG